MDASEAEVSLPYETIEAPLTGSTEAAEESGSISDPAVKEKVPASNGAASSSKFGLGALFRRSQGPIGDPATSNGNGRSRPSVPDLIHMGSEAIRAAAVKPLQKETRFPKSWGKLEGIPGGRGGDANGMPSGNRQSEKTPTAGRGRAIPRRDGASGQGPSEGSPQEVTAEGIKSDLAALREGGNQQCRAQRHPVFDPWDHSKSGRCSRTGT